jgi:dipeptidyl aminopeptidase/acylaminoacyl peptidase
MCARSRRLAQDPRSDAGQILRHPAERNLQAVSFTYERKEWRILDPAIEPDLAYLRQVVDGELEILTRSLDDRYWTLAYVTDNGPVRFYLYDRSARQARFLFTNCQALESLPLVKMIPKIIQSSDELDLMLYYSLPAGSDKDGDGIPDLPLPMVLFPHGGPWGRDTWGYNSIHQWLANRGYAVLSVNFRSSTGLGKAFTNAGDRQWGGAIIRDQLEAVQWAIRQGIADRARVAIMGASFGGYSTLVGFLEYFRTEPFKTQEGFKL